MANSNTTTYYTANIVTKGKDGKNRFHRVGVLFENTNRSGETYFTLKVDFPVIVQEELVFFAPKPKNDDDEAVTD